MPTDDYTSIPSTGKLKLKGVTDGRIDKRKKKKKPKSQDEGAPEPSKSRNDEDTFEDNSVVLRQLEDEDLQIRKDARRETSLVDGRKVEAGAGEEDEDVREHLQTEAERKFNEQRRKRLEERLKREGVKTHKQRVEELNKYLSGLSEHHDMPKIGPG